MYVIFETTIVSEWSIFIMVQSMTTCLPYICLSICSVCHFVYFTDDMFLFVYIQYHYLEYRDIFILIVLND